VKYVRLITFVTLVLSTLGLPAAAAFAAAKPADQAFRLSVLLDEEDGLELHWSVAPGYFLYHDKISATLNGKPLKVTTGRGEIKNDPTFGAIEVHHREATPYVDGADLPGSGVSLATYQGCRDNSVLYSPITKSIDLATFVISDDVLVTYQGCGQNIILHSPITKAEWSRQASGMQAGQSDPQLLTLR